MKEEEVPLGYQKGALAISVSEPQQAPMWPRTSKEREEREEGLRMTQGLPTRMRLCSDNTQRTWAAEFLLALQPRVVPGYYPPGHPSRPARRADARRFRRWEAVARAVGRWTEALCEGGDNPQGGGSTLDAASGE